MAESCLIFVREVQKLFFDFCDFRGRASIQVVIESFRVIGGCYPVSMRELNGGAGMSCWKEGGRNVLGVIGRERKSCEGGR